MNDIKFFQLPDCLDKDFTAHNETARALWASFSENRHNRTPIQLATNPRMLMQDSRYHKQAPDYRSYMTDPEVMSQCILEWLYWMRFLLPGDHDKGLPEAWEVHIDFQNFYDAVSLGGHVAFHAGQVPYADPILHDDNKHMLFDLGQPEPFAGEWAERVLRFFEHYQNKSRAGWSFLGRPVVPAAITPFMGTDGPFTAAAALRGATGLCVDLLLDPEYVHTLLDFITEALITRMRAWREHFGQPLTFDDWGTADDSIEMLSQEQYREFVLPCHRKLFDAFCPNGKRGIHLCGNAQHLFPTLMKELRITAFDTGFPMDFARFRVEMGEDILLSGGPPAPLFVAPSAEALLSETTRILTSGILDGGRFILREGNNLPPCTPLENCEAFYQLGKKLGRISR